MADFHNLDRPGSWLEEQLARQLSPVAAPESLWLRIHEQRRPLRVRSAPWVMWSAVAFALLILSAGVARQYAMTRAPAMDLEKLTRREARAIAAGSAEVDFRSDNPTEIRTWVKAKSDIDIPRECLPSRAGTGNETIRLLGVRLIRMEGLSVAAITYKVGEDFAAMLVSGKHAVFNASKGSGHPSPRTGDFRETQSSSWNMGDQMYAIAFAGTNDPRRACLLCHVDRTGLVAFN